MTKAVSNNRPLLPIVLVMVFVGVTLWQSISLLSGSKKLSLEFTPVDFASIDGWQTDDMGPALTAFLKSCNAIKRMPPNRSIKGAKIGGKARDWQPICDKAFALQDGLSDDVDQNASLIRQYFENHFTALSVSIKGQTQGKFTGYYEPLLYGSETKSERFNTPLLARPDDLVMVELGDFRSSLKGRRIAGRVKNGKLIPYADRAAIEKGALKDRENPLVWVDDAVMAFSLHIQGSGRVQMEDGRMLRAGYQAQNGHPYVAIGRVMVREGLLKKEEVSMPAIQKWLRENPDDAERIMHTNPSYIFMRLYEGDGPYGSAGVPLTAERSLAIDRLHLPLNAPIFLNTTFPDPNSAEGSGEMLSFKKLMITQDTGGAIRGEIRGDIFWGFGKRAEEIAGRMANAGQYTLLLPHAVAHRYLNGE